MAPKGLQAVKSLFKPAKSKTPAELVKETAELLSLPQQTLSVKEKERVRVRQREGRECGGWQGLDGVRIIRS